MRPLSAKAAGAPQTLAGADAAALQAQLAPVLQSGVLGVIVADAEGRLLEANDAFLWLVGWDRDHLEAGRLRWDDLTDAAEREGHPSVAAALRRHGRVPVFATTLVRKNGTRAPVLVLGIAAYDATCTRWTTTVLPLLERESAAEAQRATDARLAAIVTSASDAILTVDGDGRIVVFNEAAERMFGCDAAAAIGVPLARLVPDAPQPRPEHRMQPLVGRRANGETFPIEAALSTAEVSGQPLCTIVVRDVTERRRVEEQRARFLERAQRAQAEAEAASRMKDEFLATLSHELRTPLTAALTWTQLLRTRPLDQPTTARAIETVERCTVAMAHMIDDLLDVSRIVAGKLHVGSRPVDLAAVVCGAIEGMRPIADEKHVRLEHAVAEDAGTVLGDAARLQQIVGNLLSNAIKFTRRGGVVRCELAGSGDVARIVVADTGVGIAPDFLPYVFERFRQANGSSARAHGGLGLGLAIVRHLVRLHGGTVEAASDGPGRGARFTVTLPLVSGEVRAVAEAPAGDGAAARLDGVRVLLVEDHADARQSVAAVLEDAGARVVAVATAAEAAHAFAHARPDVVLSDIALPGEDGYALVRRIRAGWLGVGRDVPAAALTAYAGFEDRERALDAGFDEHFAKPIDPATLVRELRRLIDRCAPPENRT